MEKSIHKLTRELLITKGIVVSASILAVIIAVVVAVVAGFSLTYVNYFNSPVPIYNEGVLPATPYVFHLEGSGSPVVLTLPNDLTDRIGNIYRIWSKTNQPHTVTITGTGTTFDGVSTQAVFGGSIGDGFTFEVISKNRIVLGIVSNVIFN